MRIVFFVWENLTNKVRGLNRKHTRKRRQGGSGFGVVMKTLVRAFEFV